jgi:hypothetical protein
VVVAPWGRVVLPAALGAGVAVTYGAYTYYTGLLAECQKRIDGDPVDRTTYPAFRALGAAVLRARPATINWCVIPCTLGVLKGYSPSTVADLVQAAIVARVNSAKIGETVDDWDVTSSPSIATIPGIDFLRTTFTAQYVAPDVANRTKLAYVTVVYGS